MPSITRRPNGRWRARYRDPHGREHARHFRTRTDAQWWLSHVGADLITGRYVDPRAGTTTLADYYTTYAARQLWLPSTRRSIDHTITTSPLAELPLSRITRAEVETWVKDMHTRGLAPSTITTRLATLRSVLNAAVHDRRIHDNPTTGVRTPRAGLVRSRGLPTEHEVGLLVDLAPDPVDLCVHLAAEAGLRLGEIRGLQVHDVDLGHGTLTVRRQIQDTPSGWQVAPPKYDSTRTIPLSDDLAEHLHRHLTGRGLSSAREAFVLPGRNAGPIHPGTVARGWHQAKASAGITAPLRLHDLRHYYASAQIAQGVDVVTVQHRLGHARATTTLDTYAHLWRAI